MKRIPTFVLAAGAAMLLSACDGGGGSGGSTASSSPDDQASASPNILFVMMDDVGIDQMQSFGYGGTDRFGQGVAGPKMPNMDTVANAGIKFRNTWAQPECSPARASFFVGRYPSRTRIYQALGENDLAGAQLSPYESTTPKILRKAGYKNAMFGKFHLSGPHHNPDGYMTPAVLGWDYFYGWIEGMPEAIDTTAGGVAPQGTYSCGFVPKPAGADQGVCHYSPESGRAPVLARDLPGSSKDSAGLKCLTSGGIFVPGASASDPVPAGLKFGKTDYNGYYSSPLLEIDNGKMLVEPGRDEPIRGYRTTIETDAAIRWIKMMQQNEPDTPWMATVSYTSAHTPWQSPPGALISEPLTDGRDCLSPARGMIIQNRMTEAMDTEFGRLLVETGLASRAADGTLEYDPQASNTLIVIIGDNGTLAMAVKQPFDNSRAKGTAYQTGVWVPLIVAGPMVADAGRKVESMVNGVDLFELFGEIAGIDVHQEVPRTLDSVGLRDYLVNPDQPTKRTINFAIGGLNQQVGDLRNGPCVVDPTVDGNGNSNATPSQKTCMQVATNKHICEDNKGVWWGAGHDPLPDLNGYPAEASYNTCAEVNRALYAANNDPDEIYQTIPDLSMALRNDDYKLVRNTYQLFDPASAGTADEFYIVQTEEFYQVDQAEGTPLLDTAANNLLDDAGQPKTPLDANAANAFQVLEQKLDSLMSASLDCPGDGNLDGKVDKADLDAWADLAANWGKSSVYDFSGYVNPEGDLMDLPDGKTDGSDAALIQRNLDKPCTPTYALY